MHRIVFFPPYAALGLILIVALGWFVLSVSADPRALAYECIIEGEPRSGADCTTARYAAALGVLPIEESNEAELRIWTPTHYARWAVWGVGETYTHIS